jgi:uncharacterized integral membrane protein (TIGR00698 family)
LAELLFFTKAMSNFFSVLPFFKRVMGSVQGVLPGLLLTGAITALAGWVAQWRFVEREGISALTLAIVLGMVVGNLGLEAVQGPCAEGVGFARNRLLRLGIVLYGLRLTLQDVAHVGWSGVVIDVIVVGGTFLLAVHAGTRWLRLDRDTAMLVGAGSAICGAAAVLATEPLLRAPAGKVAVAVATVVVFGTAGMFVYPALYHLAGQALGMSALQYGVYAGSTVHEVAQVVAAARARDHTKFSLARQQRGFAAWPNMSLP